VSCYSSCPYASARSSSQGRIDAPSRMASSRGCRGLARSRLWRLYGGHLAAGDETAILMLGHRARSSASRSGIRGRAAAINVRGVERGDGDDSRSRSGTWALDFMAAGRRRIRRELARLTPAAMPC